MKYGQQLEHESVPQWCLHNLDYNSLKHEIKAHTSKNQATAQAVAIPGHQDVALHKFEDGLYLELCRQHERVHLFITSKADEISRRLIYLERSIGRWLVKCTENPAPSEFIKHQRRFIKYDRELMLCADDINALTRFANAQIVAFRKIIKKYKKWTGSTTLGSRFNRVILSDPKSFTNRSYTALREQNESILQNLRNAFPALSQPSSPSTDGNSLQSRPSSSSRRPDFEPLPPPFRQEQHPQQQQAQAKYWNEYDDGSEAGGPEDDYAIYINPNESGFPGFGYVQAILHMPFEKAKSWFRSRRNPEQEPLLDPSRPRTRCYTSVGTASTDSDEEGYASSSEFPVSGFSAQYAFPSIADQKVSRYREKVMLWTTIGSFLMSFILFAISGVLVTTGRHKLRVEVDAVVTVGVALSILCACFGLGAALYRKDHLSILHRMTIGSVFIASCILNAMLLVLVVDNAP